jgi:hypothetical protein
MNILLFNIFFLRSGKVQVNDQIIEVDGQTLHGYTNQQANRWIDTIAD